MKLLTNNNYDSLFLYFPGIDYPNVWTLENPAIFHYVKDKDKNRVLLSKFIFLSDAKYLLFKTERKTVYSIKAQVYRNNYYVTYKDNIKILLYDFLSFSKDDVEKNKNALKQFIVHSNYDNQFSFDYSTYVLMKIMPNNESALSSNNVENSHYLYFNNDLLQFQYGAHFIRDWEKVDGKTWNINGKLNSSNSLYCLNKNVGRSYLY